MSHFLSNLPRLQRSKVPHGPGAALGGRPLVYSSYPAMVPILMAVVNPPSNAASSFIPALSQGHGANKDLITSVEPFESALQVPISRVGLLMSRTIADIFPFVFAFLSNG